MAVNKIIYAGETLIDLTGDTAVSDVVLDGYIFHDRSGNETTGACTFDSDTKDATAVASQILKGQTAYAQGNKISGSMENRGAIAGTISTKSGQYTIPVGYHDGGGKVSISATEQAKLVPANIAEGVTILGVQGSHASGTAEVKQSKTVTPTKAGFDVNPDSGYTCLSTVTVNPIPYTQQANAAGGTTVQIA